MSCLIKVPHALPSEVRHGRRQLTGLLSPPVTEALAPEISHEERWGGVVGMGSRGIGASAPSFPIHTLEEMDYHLFVCPCQRDLLCLRAERGAGDLFDVFSLLIDSLAVGVHFAREGKHVGFHFQA